MVRLQSMQLHWRADSFPDSLTVVVTVVAATVVAAEAVVVMEAEAAVTLAVVAGAEAEERTV